MFAPKRRKLFSILIFTSFLVISFQNCGPSKLEGNTNSSSTYSDANSDQPENTPFPVVPVEIGAKIDIGAVLASPKEASTNLLYPTNGISNWSYEGIMLSEYTLGSPVFENVVLKNNDFSKIEWISESLGEVVGGGDSFYKPNFTNELAGRYMVVGYRGSSTFLLARYEFKNRLTAAAALGTQSVSYKQKLIEADSEYEKILLTVESPTVDVSGIQFINGTLTTRPVIAEGKRALLITKKLSESLFVTLKLSAFPSSTFTQAQNLTVKVCSPNGLIALYKFDHSTGFAAADFVGSNNASIANINPDTPTAPWTSSAKMGYALRLDGADDYLTVQNTAFFDNQRIFSVCSWALLESGGGNNPRIFQKSANADSTSGVALYLSTSNGKITFEYPSGHSVSSDDGYWQFDAALPALSTWNHVCITYDANLLSMPKLYLNGASYDPIADSARSPSRTFVDDSPFPFIIGSQTVGLTPSGLWKGRFDDFRVYNKILTNEEVQRIYSLGSGCPAP